MTAAKLSNCIFLFEITVVRQRRKGAHALIISLGSVYKIVHAILKLQAPVVSCLAMTG